MKGEEGSGFELTSLGIDNLAKEVGEVLILSISALPLDRSTKKSPSVDGLDVGVSVDGRGSGERRRGRESGGGDEGEEREHEGGGHEHDFWRMGGE